MIKKIKTSRRHGTEHKWILANYDGFNSVGIWICHCGDSKRMQYPTVTDLGYNEGYEAGYGVAKEQAFELGLDIEERKYVNNPDDSI